MKVLLDVKALERLLAGDSKIEVELRNGIVQEFARRHLKAIANDEEFQKLVKAQMDSVRFSVEKEMSDLFENVKKDSWGTVVRQSFKEDIKKKIQAEAAMVIEREISKHINALITARLDEISQTVNAYCDSILEKYTRRTLDEMVEAKFKKAIARV